MKTRLYTFALTALVCSTIATLSEQPLQVPQPIMLDEAFPESFGVWREVNLQMIILPLEQNNTETPATTHYKAYENEFGRIVTLVAVSGSVASDTVRVHLPENCYVAQGFAIENRTTRDITVSNSMLSVVELETNNPFRAEYVTYFLKSGDNFITHAYEFELSELLNTDRVRDTGILFRLSSRGTVVENRTLHERFLRDMASALEPEYRSQIFGDGA